MGLEDSTIFHHNTCNWHGLKQKISVFFAKKGFLFFEVRNPYTTEG